MKINKWIDKDLNFTPEGFKIFLILMGILAAAVIICAPDSNQDLVGFY
jgi:hypothetical protein